MPVAPNKDPKRLTLIWQQSLTETIIFDKTRKRLDTSEQTANKREEKTEIGVLSKKIVIRHSLMTSRKFGDLLTPPLHQFYIKSCKIIFTGPKFVSNSSD